MSVGEMSIAIVAIVLGTSILWLPIVLVFVYLVRRNRRGALDNRQAQLLEQIWGGLEKMDGRITNLEVILLGKQADQSEH